MCSPDRPGSTRNTPEHGAHSVSDDVAESSLLVVGAPTTWPSVLAALHWLVELVIDRVFISAYLDGDGLLSAEHPGFSHINSWNNGDWVQPLKIRCDRYEVSSFFQRRSERFKPSIYSL